MANETKTKYEDYDTENDIQYPNQGSERGVVNPDGQGAEGGGGGTTGGGEIPVPVRQNRNVRELGDYEAPYSAKDLKRAQRQGRRESRMATAGHIMDTMARLFNYGATVNGGPSAHWANRNQEFDRNTYYAKLKGANDKARQDYWNMRLNAGKADNDEYQTDINLYDKQKKWKDKEDERNQKQPLIDADVENKNADTENKKAQAESQRIRNQYLPNQLKAENEETKARAAEHVASANKTAGRGVFKIYAGNGKDDVYHNETEWQDHLTQEATDLGINLRDYLTTTTTKSGRNGGATVTEKEQDKIDWSKVAGAIRQKKMVLEEE